MFTKIYNKKKVQNYNHMGWIVIMSYAYIWLWIELKTKETTCWREREFREREGSVAGCIACSKTPQRNPQ